MKAEKCEMCGSTDDYLNFHHLIPRTLHSNKFFEKNYEKSGIWHNVIINAGYYPYIIKDMGSFNIKFVENEFVKFVQFTQVHHRKGNGVEL